MAVGDKEGWEGGHLLSMALSSAVGSDGMEALVSGAKPWTSPEVVEARLETAPGEGTEWELRAPRDPEARSAP